MKKNLGRSWGAEHLANHPLRSTFCNLASPTASSVQATSSSADPSGNICFLETKMQLETTSVFQKIHFFFLI